MRKIRKKIIDPKHKYIVVLGLTLTIATLVVVSGRFVYNTVLQLFYQTKNFYFESDKLTLEGAHYLLDHWNGVDPYTVTVNVNSFKNSKLKSTSDIEYNIEYSCSSTVVCDASKTEGVIYSENNTDSFSVQMTPTSSFSTGDDVVISITATSTEPYHKTLTATFKLVVGYYGLSHEIVDSVGNVYLEVKVTNTLDYYKVKERFLSYNVGDMLSVPEYLKLSDANKKKCASAVVSMNFDPNLVKIDNNSTSFQESYNVSTKLIGRTDYINGFSFDIAPLSSSVIKFYKNNSDVDYSSGLSTTDVVDVDYSF